MNYESWRISYQSSEQAARAAFHDYVKAYIEKQELLRVVKHAASLYGEAESFLESWLVGDFDSCKEYGFQINKDAYKP